jgi:hypothetical protein
MLNDYDGDHHILGALAFDIEYGRWAEGNRR